MLLCMSSWATRSQISQSSDWPSEQWVTKSTSTTWQGRKALERIRAKPFKPVQNLQYLKQQWSGSIWAVADSRPCHVQILISASSFTVRSAPFFKIGITIECLQLSGSTPQAHEEYIIAKICYSATPDIFPAFDIVVFSSSRLFPGGNSHGNVQIHRQVIVRLSRKKRDDCARSDQFPDVKIVWTVGRMANPSRFGCKGIRFVFIICHWHP